VVCAGCACLCDDITVSFERDQLVEFQPPCALGRAWFETHAPSACAGAELQGVPTEFSNALVHAKELLDKSDYPLVYGLSRSSTPGQRAAVELAEYLGGVVDTTASLCHGPSIMALQEFGEVTCTLGEVRNRADLVIFWGCNPADSHPRHAERYSVHPRGKYVPGGRRDRKIVMIGDATSIEDWQLDHQGTQPDLRIAVEPGKDFEMLAQLRALLKGSETADVPAELQQLMSMMRGCKYGVVFFGLGLAETGAWGGTRRTGTGHINVGALLQMVAELNAVTRFCARRMRLQGDVSGADNVLCWQTAYPFAVDFSRGYPRYNPGEFTANELLERGDVDVALLIGAETVPYFTPKARRHLDAIPTIVLDYPGAARPLHSQVDFTTAVYGIHAAGTAYRMDNVPLQLRKLLDTPLPTDEEVLLGLLSQLKSSVASV
jgi:formylmethanofuran dehydrogenase subunit B